MYAIGIGYPLGIRDDKYIVEYNKEISITFQEAAVWMSFNGIKQIHDLNEDKNYFNNLVSLGIVVNAQSLTELGKKLRNIVPVRQGAGSAENGIPAIFIGDKTIKPIPLHYSIWKLCNGNRNVLKIYKSIQKEYKISYEDFIKNLSCLDELDLVFLT